MLIETHTVGIYLSHLDRQEMDHFTPFLKVTRRWSQCGGDVRK